MSLEISKLENVVEGDDGRIVARCPACAKQGRDNTGNHLIIYASGAFGCVVYAGKDAEAADHRKAIYRLSGRGAAADGTGLRFRVPPWNRP